MANSEFLAKIKLALDGKDTVVSGLQQTQKAVQKLSKTKVSTTFDKEGVVTGKQIEETFRNINTIVPKSKSVVDEFGTVMRKALVVAPVWIILRSAIMGVMQSIQALPSAAIAWEKEMAQIKRVGKGTEGEYALLSARLLELAKNYGIASATMGQGAALWAQQGKNMTEIVPLMETTIKLSLITGKTVSESVDDITAIMKSYRVEASATSGILDKLIKVEQEHAITTNVLTDAMKKGGPVAAQFGVPFEKFLGIITATHVATRASGGEIGNAWKTIFARMATSAIPAIQNIARVPVYMDKAGKATYQNTGTFREWGNVLDEVMVSMTTLNETQQIALTSALAQKRTLNYLLSAYQNWDEGVKATVESLDSFGASDKALNVLLGTTASKMSQLQSAWGDLGVTIINNGQGIRDTIDLLKGLVNGANDVVMLFHGVAGAELQASKQTKEVLDEEIARRTKEKGQLAAILELRKLLGETKAFEARITEDPKLEKAQKTKILSVIEDRQKFIQETLDNQPKIVEDESFLDATLVRAEELQKLRDKLSVMILEAPKKMTQGTTYDLNSQKTLDELENRLKTFKGSVTGFVDKPTIDYLEKIVELKKEEAKITAPDYLGIIEKRLEKEKEFNALNKEYMDNDSQLTEQQKAQLSMERELSTFAIQRGATEEQILNKKLELLKVTKKFSNEQQRTLDIEQTQNQLIETRLKFKVTELQKNIGLVGEILRLAGEEESTIIRQTMVLNSRFEGENYLNKLMGDRLKLAEALTREADAQEKKSAHLLDLFKISKKYGINVAQEVSQFIGGKKPLSKLSTEAIKAVKKFEQPLYESEVASQYFRKYNKEREYGEKIFKFPEKIEEERKRQRNINILNKVMIEPIKVDVRLESDKVMAKIKMSILKELDNRESELHQKINKQIENF